MNSFNNSELVTVKLYKFFCLPVLMYAVEETIPSKSCKTSMNSLNYCINVCIRFLAHALGKISLRYKLQ